MVRDVLYRLYERQLTAELRRAPRPRHVGVILDGNRRYARAHRLDTVVEGHRKGAAKIPELLDWCDELDIPYVTLWLLSTDNLQRASDELDSLCSIIGETIAGIAGDPRNADRGVRITAVGALDSLPDELRGTLKDAEEVTRDRSRLHLQVAVGYGGRQEIIDALRSLLEKRQARQQTLAEVIADLRTEDIAEHLYTTGLPDPDLIIRTSGEIRLSGFLLWQSAHSEFYFCDPYWPEFRKTDFLRALRDFAQRHRRYGR